MGEALRAVLKCAVRNGPAAAEARNPSEEDRRLLRLISKVTGLVDRPVVEDTSPIRGKPKIGTKYKKEEGETHPGNRWFNPNAKDIPKEKVVAFLDEYPGWYDSRHMGEFLARVSKELSELSDKPRNMCIIRDRYFHGFTLMEGESITRVQLEQEVERLRELVERLAHVALVKIDDVPEYKALLQLQSALPRYFKWRTMQRVAAEKFNTAERFEKAILAVRGLKAALADGGLGSMCDGDASQESLAYLLRLRPFLSRRGPMESLPVKQAAAAAPRFSGKEEWASSDESVVESSIDDDE